MKKKAVIRGENVRPCPFGLPVPQACMNAGAVDCDFGDTGEGQTDPSIKGSPLYPQAFGLNNGLYSLPLGYYKDDNMRNIPFGLFSLIGKDDFYNDLIKLADLLDDMGESDVANKIDDILFSNRPVDE
jgi:hypothetical protein